MVNQITYNKIPVVSIEFRQTRDGKYPKSKVLALKNGDFVSASTARKDKIQIRCSNCGNMFSIGYRDENETKPYLCKRCSCSGERNPFFGKCHTEDMKKQQSQKMKGRYVGEKNPMFGKNIKDFMSKEKYDEWKKHHSFPGEKNPMFGKKISDHMSKGSYEEWLRKHKEAHKQYPPEKRLEISRKLSAAQRRYQMRDPEEYSKVKARGGRAASNKQTMYRKTKPESILENYLKQNNISYDYSAIMGDSKRNYQYDFIIHGKRILIEVDGDYWHANPNYKPERPLTEQQKKNILNDKEKDKFAEEHNFKLIRIWESEIKNGDFSKIKEALND